MSTALEAAPTAPSDGGGRRKFWKALLGSPTAFVGFSIVGLIGVLAIVGPLLFGDAADEQHPSNAYAPASLEHPFGTDRLGRDVLLRCLVAVRPSLIVALGATGIALVLGTLIGLGAASLGPKLRAPALRAIDASLAFPGMLTAILVMVSLGANMTAATVGVGISMSFSTARLVSSLSLGEAGRDYHLAAKVLGLSKARIMFRYTLPNIAPALVAGISVAVGHAIVVVAALSFLGLGIQAPAYDLGTMLTEGMQAIFQSPLGAIMPAAFISLMALAAGLVGDATARALNPRLWTSASKPPKRSTQNRSGAATESSSDGDLAAPPVAPVVETTHAVADEDVLLRLRDVTVRMHRDGAPLDIVRNVSFTMKKGDVVGIVGESGSGKTMTALAISGLVPLGGEVLGDVVFRGHRLNGLDAKEADDALANHLSFIFQDPMTSLNPALTIGTQMTLGARRYAGLNRKAALTRAAALLDEVRLPAVEKQLRRYPQELSGGMRQRVMIAQALMMEPSLIIADEPTTALDVTVQAQIMKLLREVNESHGTGIVFISHDLHLVADSCDRILVMYAGRVVEEGDARSLMGSPLHPYTDALLGAVPQDGQPRNSRLDEIPGQVAELNRLPGGCSFHPRCPLANDRCREEEPALLQHESGRRVACHVANIEVAS